MATLEILNGPQAGQKVSITQETFFLGRDANNHVVLTDRTVSRKHAVINQLEGQFIISDLKSLKGLLVNGSKVEEAILQDGDEIAIGALRLGFFLKTPEGEGPLPGEKKNRPIKWMIGLACIALAGSAYYFGFVPSPFHPSKKVTKSEGEMEQHYRLGVQLFNEQKDMEGAKREWEQVLALDPQKSTVFGQKAAKLLENVHER